MYMFKYIMTRLLFMLLALFVIFTLTFFLIKNIDLSVPEVPAGSPEYEAIMDRYERLGYFDPIGTQYVRYIKSLLIDGDWGVSFRLEYGKDISEILATRLPPTVIMNVLSFVISVPLGLLFGILAAKVKNSFGDAFISTAVMVVVSVPSYVYALLLQLFLGYRLGLPATILPIDQVGGNWLHPDMLYSMTIPIIALSLGTVASLTRFSRAELSEVMTNDYMLLARTKGLTKQQALSRHAMRNAMVPIFPSIISGFISVLFGSLVIENIFVVPGIGNLYLASIQTLDYNVFLGVSIFYTTIGLVGTLIVDLSYGVIDPRIRMGAR